MTKLWTIWNFFTIIFLSLLPYVAWMFIADNFPDLDMSYTLPQLLRSWTFYLVILLNLGLFLCWELGQKVFLSQFRVDYDWLLKYMLKYGYLNSMSEHRLKAQFSKQTPLISQVSQK